MTVRPAVSASNASSVSESSTPIKAWSPRSSIPTRNARSAGSAVGKAFFGIRLEQSHHVHAARMLDSKVEAQLALGARVERQLPFQYVQLAVIGRLGIDRIELDLDLFVTRDGELVAHQQHLARITQVLHFY